MVVTIVIVEVFMVDRSFSKKSDVADLNSRGMAPNAQPNTYSPSEQRQSRSNKSGAVGNDSYLVVDVFPHSVFSNHKTFINTVREGVPGCLLKQLIDLTGLRETFLTILNVRNRQLSYLYRRKRLGQSESESVLDSVRLLNHAEQVFESRDLAMQWLHNPVPALSGAVPLELFDTFEGRRWVSQVLAQIEYGDFS